MIGEKISWNCQLGWMVYKVLPWQLSVGSEGEQTLSLSSQDGHHSWPGWQHTAITGYSSISLTCLDTAAVLTSLIQLQLIWSDRKLLLLLTAYPPTSNLEYLIRAFEGMCQLCLKERGLTGREIWRHPIPHVWMSVWLTHQVELQTTKYKGG